MSEYTTTYQTRYSVPSLQEQIEVGIIHASEDIQNEDVTTPDHANRLIWANWANKNSSIAWGPFAWPVALNPTIAASIAADPSGATVVDADVQFAVNSALPKVLADFIANPPSGVTIPPPPEVGPIKK